MNKVTLEYWLLNDSEFKSLDIPVDEYFDPLDEGEELEIGSVPRFIQPYQYVPEDLAKIKFLKLEVAIEGKIIQFKQTFWNGGNDFLTERIDLESNDTINYKKLIITTKMPDKEDTYQIIRLLYGSENILPVYHGYITTRDGGDIEQKIDTSIFNKE